MNIGKIFEQEIKDSVPKEHFYYRFRDSATFGSGENTRFTTSNICDCMVVTDEFLFLLELKSHKGTSLPFSCIRKNQIDQMADIDHKKIKAYFIINFREKEKTFAVAAKELKEYMETTERKSIPIQWCVDNGIAITGIKKKVKFRYKLDDFFNQNNLLDEFFNQNIMKEGD